MKGKLTVPHVLTLWHWNFVFYFFILANPVCKNVTNTETKKGSIMKQTAF
jgi:hypothetical protein